MTDVRDRTIRGDWKAIRRFWPFIDVEGNWLIATPTERRPLLGGGFEYRAALDSK